MPPEAAGERLDRFLAACEGVGSRAAAERLLGERRRARRRRGAPEEPPAGRRRGARVRARPSAARRRLEPEPVAGLRVAYEDEHLLVVDKPAGVVVHPSAGHAHGTLVHGLLSREIEGGEEPERPGIVHRLDRDTSGLLVVARSDEAHRRLQRLLRRRELVREYLALVRGRPRSRAGRIEAPIGRDRRDPTRHSLDTATPREAATTFEVLELAAARTRSCASGWRRGGPTRSASTSPRSTCRWPATRSTASPGDLGLERQFLHAARLAFPHPFTGRAGGGRLAAARRTSRRALDMARTGDAGGARPGLASVRGSHPVTSCSRPVASACLQRPWRRCSCSSASRPRRPRRASEPARGRCAPRSACRASSTSTRSPARPRVVARLDGFLTEPSTETPAGRRPRLRARATRRSSSSTTTTSPGCASSATRPTPSACATCSGRRRPAASGPSPTTCAPASRRTGGSSTCSGSPIPDLELPAEAVAVVAAARPSRSRFRDAGRPGGRAAAPARRAARRARGRRASPAATTPALVLVDHGPRRAPRLARDRERRLGRGLHVPRRRRSGEVLASANKVERGRAAWRGTTTRAPPRAGRSARATSRRSGWLAGERDDPERDVRARLLGLERRRRRRHVGAAWGNEEIDPTTPWELQRLHARRAGSARRPLHRAPARGTAPTTGRSRSRRAGTPTASRTPCRSSTS